MTIVRQDIPSHSDGRRLFLRRTIAGTLFLALGRTPLLASSHQTVRDSRVFFDASEAEIFGAIADRIIGPRKKESLSLDTIVARADAFLAAEHPEVQEQFHLLLTLFNSALIALLFDARFSSFVEMDPSDKDSYLLDWMNSPLSFRRTAFQALKRLSMSVYYTHQGAFPGIGFDGDYSG